VTRQRIGRRIAWRLTVRGRDILEGRVPARLRGLGPYDGLASLREKTKQERQQKALDARWAAAKGDNVLAPLVAGADRLIAEWSTRNAPRCFNDALRHKYYAGQLIQYVRGFVLRQRALPLGCRDSLGGRSAVPFVVDFDELLRVAAASDVLVENHGSIVLIRPRTPEAETRLRTLVADDAKWWGGALVCEPRYVSNILDALQRSEG